MAHNNSEEEFNELMTAFFQGRMTRRRFIQRAAQLGLSAALVSRIVSATFAATDNLLESSSVAPNESPITRERVDYLKSKPYKNTTINVMVTQIGSRRLRRISRAEMGGGNRRARQHYQDSNRHAPPGDF